MYGPNHAYFEFKRIIGAAMMLVVSGASAPHVLAQRPVVPGTGSEIVGVADDFEDPQWEYIPRDPKSTEDIDENQRGPMGRSTNGRWYEGIKRGHPDVVKRVLTPSGGLARQRRCLADAVQVHRNSGASQRPDASRRFCRQRAVPTPPHHQHLRSSQRDHSGLSAAGRGVGRSIGSPLSVSDWHSKRQRWSTRKSESASSNAP